MNLIETLVAKLSKYPQLVLDVKVNSISVKPMVESGFTVWLTANNPGFTVGFDGWHEEFEDEREALGMVGFGLSSQCRLKTIMMGDTDCKWIVEVKSGDEWIARSSTGLILVPFWRSKTVVYRQNDVVDWPEM
jgi:hypothetical protein